MWNYMPIKRTTKRNGQILKMAQSPKTEPGRNRKYEQTKHKYWNWNHDGKFPTNKSAGNDDFTGEFYQIFREELKPIFLKLFPKIKEDKTFPSLLFKANITLLPKKKKNHKKRKLQANITDEHRHKNPQQNSSKRNSIIHLKDHIPWPSGIYPRVARMHQ